MPILLRTILISFFLFLSSCGIKDNQTNNNIEPNDRKKNITFKIISRHIVKYTDIGIGIGIDKTLSFRVVGNGFILINNKARKITVSDSSLTPLNSFGKDGQGPGEFQSISGLCFDDIYIYVSDDHAKKISIFDYSGNFVKWTSPKIEGANIIDCFDNSFLLNAETTAYEDNNNLALKSSIITVDSIDASFGDTLRTITKKAKNGIIQYSYSDMVVLRTFSDSVLYVVNNSEQDYNILTYNRISGKSKGLTKKYAKIKFNDFDDRKDYAGSSFYFGSNFSNGDDKQNSLYKKAINGIWYDQGYLFVAVSKVRNKENQYLLYLDVWKSGKYIQTLELDFLKWYDSWNPDKIIFQNGKIYISNNEDLTLSIFDYKITETIK